MAETSAIVPQSCILMATADWDDPYWTNKQHCAKALAELGVSVLYVESVGLRAPKMSSGRDWRRLRNRLLKGFRSLIWGAQKREHGISVLSPLLIPAAHRNSLFRNINKFLLWLSIARSMSGKMNKRPVLWTYHPFMLDAIPKRLRGPILYHCVDDLSAVPGVNADVFRSAENALLQRANVVFATAPSLVERCKIVNSNTHFLPNVVDDEHFGKGARKGEIPRDVLALPEPRLVYHGVLSDFKLDIQLMIDSARSRPCWQWILIGEEREGQKSALLEEFSSLPNVHFLGYRPYDVLPDYLRGMNVGLLPSLLNDYTRAMFPMKYFEYIAAGLPVAATPLDALVSSNQSCVAFGADSHDFCAAIEQQIARGRLTDGEVKRAIGTNTWKSRTMRMLTELEQHL